MHKRLKKVKCLLVASMCLCILSGCDNEKNSVEKPEGSLVNTSEASEEASSTDASSSDASVLTQEDFINKYAANCELGQYMGIEYTKVKTEVTDEMVQLQVDAFLTGYATDTEQVFTGTTKNGDTVNIDFVGSMDGVEFDGGSSQGAGYDLTLGSGTMIDGFEEQIVGHEVGEVFDIDVTFPDNYGATDLAGKDAVFQITINYILVNNIPEYTDEFVAENTDYDTIVEFEQSIKDNLIESYGQYDNSSNRVAVFNQILENSTFSEIPADETSVLVESAMSDNEMMAANYGYDLDTYIQYSYGMTTEEFEAYITNLAQEYVKEKMIHCAIAKTENIRVSGDEISEYKEMMMTETGYTDEEAFDSIYSYEDVMYYTLAEKVQVYILENANPM